VYRCLNGTAPPYLAETLRQSTVFIVNETRRIWRPRLPGSGCTRLERLAIFYPGCVIIAAVLPGTEDRAVFIVI